MIKGILIATIMAFSGLADGEKTKVDVKASSVKWVGKKVTGQHNGTISLEGGRLEMEDGKLTGGLFTINMATIVCEDLSGGGKEKLEGHLNSPDFFDVAKYPTATFVITKAVPQGPENYKVVGNITIKGTTEEIQFPVKLKTMDGKYVATADLKIDRSKFDVKYGSGSFFDDLGDKTIYDDFELSIKLVTAD